MIKASKMSLTCGLFTDHLEPSKKSIATKELLQFTTGDPTAYGIPQLRIPESVYDIVRKAILNPKNHSYTGSNGSQDARAAVAKHYGREGVSAADVIMTHGANMGLYIALMSITNPGDNILVPQPGYPFFKNTAPVTYNYEKIYIILMPFFFS